MKLISMTDFVLEKNDFGLFKNNAEQIRDYAKFIKLPLKLDMFIPCDNYKVIFKGFEISFLSVFETVIIDNKENRIVFRESGTWFRNKKIHTIEELVKFDLECEINL